MKDLMKLDLYELLNIKLTATEAEIKKAYRKKALTCHPDKNPDNPKADEDFKQLSKAVELLTNDATRADYDKLLRERRAARSKTVYVIHTISKVTRKYPKTKESKEKKQSNETKEKKKKPCFHCKKGNPFSFTLFKDSYENGKFHSRKGCSCKKNSEKTVPTWPPSASKTKKSKQHSYGRNKNFGKKSFPTWPPTSHISDSEISSDSEEQVNSNSDKNSPLIRPATFVPPSSTEFENMFKQDSRKTFSPLIKPAKFVAPSNSKNSDGFHSTNQKGSSPILKPATFVAPSKS